VPVFARVYDQFHAQLPVVTLSLIAVSYVFVHYWWMVALVLLGTILLVRRLIRTPNGRLRYDRLKLKLPLFGKLNRKIAVARFTRTLSAMVRAGVPILESLRTSTQTCGNVVFVYAMAGVAQLVKEGSRLSKPMEETGEFPPMVTRMIAAGEESGNLDAMLQKLAEFYERDVEYSIGRLTRMLEPALTVFVGGIVLFVLLALYMPIFNLSSVLKRP
jgi:type II secretory pathway component PulF